MAKTPAKEMPLRQRCLTRLAGLDRRAKRALLIGMDFTILAFALWAGFAVRLNEFYVPPSWRFAAILAAAPLIGIVVFWRFGLYRLVTRYIDASAARKMALAVFTTVLVWSLFFQMTGTYGGLPRSAVIAFGGLSIGLVWLSRTVIGWLLKGAHAGDAAIDADRLGVIIYGAGAVGVQLLEELRRKPVYRPLAFVDDAPGLYSQKINGLKVYLPADLDRLVGRGDVAEIHVADPGLSRSKRTALVDRFQTLGVSVRLLPSMADIASGRVSVSDLKEIAVNDLLGRAPVAADPALLELAIRGKAVLVTGAGGSIGSELTRQIVRLAPRDLVLFEVSEAALYTIEMELRQLALATVADQVAPRITGVLGSVLDAGAVRGVIAQYRIDTIFHAAAYKHVPIVEANPVAGIRNNAFGTQVVAEAARDLGVGRMVLISTDKAVRPTNIMGASKRCAELVLQALAAEPGTQTVFSMVRFGNVLDSSGSVVKLFRRQIEAGGPVTVTHKDIIRYFMSIPEAAELVIQAGAMAKGGEVFVLDMGEPVKIDAMARTMIKLMGREVRDETNPDGDVAIVYTGLRPGEKLYEELLIGASTAGTAHPRIRRSFEPALTAAELNREFATLAAALAGGAIGPIRAVLQRSVEGYVPDLRAVGAGAVVEGVVEDAVVGETLPTRH